MPFDEVNDDSDAYEPSESGQTSAVKRKKKAEASGVPKKKKLRAAAEDVENNDELDVESGPDMIPTTNTKPDLPQTIKKHRDNPIATRYVYVAQCSNCEQLNLTCRVQYKHGKRGKACYPCSSRKAKCEDRGEECIIQPVSAEEKVKGEVMPEVAKPKEKQPRPRAPRKKKAVENVQEGSPDVVNNGMFILIIWSITYNLS